jgi:hypothetical protein
VGLIRQAARFVYDRSRRAWIDLVRGGVIEAAQVTAELEAQSALAAAVLETLTGQLYAGQVSLAEWQMAVAAELRDAHIAHAMCGRGGRERMNARSWGRVGGHLKDEYRWLTRFAEQVADGQVSLAQAQARIGQYARASQQAFLREWAKEQDRPEWAGLPALNQVPRDGRTRCKGNCACNLKATTRGLEWELAPAEHCEDCQRLAAGGPYRPGRL